jgi:hypothetical protein
MYAPEKTSKSLTLFGGFAPAAMAPPIAMTTYYLLSDSGHRNAPRPPKGTGGERGEGIVHEKKGFLQSKYFLNDTVSKKK